MRILSGKCCYMTAPHLIVELRGLNLKYRINLNKYSEYFGNYNFLCFTIDARKRRNITKSMHMSYRWKNCEYFCKATYSTWAFIFCVCSNTPFFPLLVSSGISSTCVRESTVDYRVVRKEQPCADTQQRGRPTPWAEFTLRKWATLVGS